MKIVGAPPSAMDETEAAIRAAAVDVGALIVPTVLQVEAPLAAHVPATDFPGLIRFLRPRLVYMFGVAFDAEDEALSQFEDEADEDWLMSLREVDALLRKWRRYNGQIVRLSVAVVADGVMHGMTERTPWGEEFGAELDNLGSVIAQAQQAVVTEKQGVLKKRIAGKVADLVADLRFSGPKVGHAKRLVLARSLHPGLNEDELDELVTEAENAYWLHTGKS